MTPNPAPVAERGHRFHFGAGTLAGTCAVSRSAAARKASAPTPRWRADRRLGRLASDGRCGERGGGSQGLGPSIASAPDTIPCAVLSPRRRSGRSAPGWGTRPPSQETCHRLAAPPGRPGQASGLPRPDPPETSWWAAWARQRGSSATWRGPTARSRRPRMGSTEPDTSWRRVAVGNRNSGRRGLRRGGTRWIGLHRFTLGALGTAGDRAGRQPRRVAGLLTRPWTGNRCGPGHPSGNLPTEPGDHIGRKTHVEARQLRLYRLKCRQ